MIDMCHVLFDDRAFVEVFGDEVCGSADDLHALVEGLVVRLGSLEAGEEGVVDVDDLAGIGSAELGGEDLHESGKNEKVDLFLFGEFRDLSFGLASVGSVEIDMYEAMTL